MYRIKYKITIALTLAITLVFSCKDLDELNINPNGVDPADGNPNLLIATVMSEVGKRVVDLGYGDIAGVMQHTQKDGWSSGHNDYAWENQRWSDYYGILRTNDELLNKAEENDLNFHKGVAHVIRAYSFGMITDLWGDAPYTSALNGEEGGAENLKPSYDNQRDIYLGIIADLETANELLTGAQDSYSDIIPSQDVLYGGEVSKWRKLANSLALRYYMRISNKEEAISRAGIEKIVSEPDRYPIITSPNDDATMDYIGASTSDSWPNNTVYDKSTTGGYNRIKLCSTMILALQKLSDPRIGVFAERVEVPLVVDANLPDDADQIIDGVRYVAQNIADEYEETFSDTVNQDPNYVGLPPSSSAGPAYNLNPDLAQGTINVHCSQLNNMYKDASGPKLLARLMSATEVHFILAEAAQKGWAAGDAKTHYDEAIRSSFETWGIGGQFNDYISGVANYDGTLEQLIEQKWISSWTAAAESWFDYRRTGFPALETGPFARRQAIPLRFYYMRDEKNLNTVHAYQAIEALEKTAYSPPDQDDSAWSKSWILQGTGKPY